MADAISRLEPPLPSLRLSPFPLRGPDTVFTPPCWASVVIGSLAGLQRQSLSKLRGGWSSRDRTHAVGVYSSACTTSAYSIAQPFGFAKLGQLDSNQLGQIDEWCTATLANHLAPLPHRAQPCGLHEYPRPVLTRFSRLERPTCFHYTTGT